MILSYFIWYGIWYHSFYDIIYHIIYDIIHDIMSSENHPGHNDKQWLQWLQCIVVIVTIVWHCNLGGWHPRGMGIAAWTPERGCWAHYNYDTMKKHWKDYQFLKLCFHFLALFSLSNIVFNALISIVTIVNHLTHYLPAQNPLKDFVHQFLLQKEPYCLATL